MRGIILIPSGLNIDFLSRRIIFFTLSLLLVLGAVALFFTKGLNYGIDFRGGIMIEAQTPEAADIGALRNTLTALNLGEVSLQEFGAQNNVLINLQKQEGDEKAQQAAVQKVKEALGDKVEYRRIEVVGPKFGDELLWNAFLAAIFSLAGIMIYVWVRFEWQFGVCGVAALLHDMLSIVGLFALTGMEFNLTTVAAILTIAGYSINDTVVVFDRVRENLRKFKTMPLPELLNLSVNETLSRTILTSTTTFLALLALLLFGGEVIRGFSIATIFGIVIGTYSTVYVASPLLLYMNISRRTGAEKAKEEEAAKAAP